MTLVKLEAVQLRTKTIVRPAGELGTCGFSPQVWPVLAFLQANKNWTIHEVYYGRA